MAIGKWMKTSGMTALVAGLALATVPSAMAQDGQGRGWRGGNGQAAAQAGDSGRSRGSGGSEWRGRSSGERSAPAWRGRQQVAPQAVAPAVTAQAAPEQRRGWQGRSDGGQRGNWQRGDGQRTDGQRWNGGRQADAPRNGVEQRQAQARDAARREGWNGRNRAYVDPNRNNWQRGDNDRPAWRGNGRNDRRWDNDRRNDRRWDNGWRNDRRYNWQSYRNSNRNVYRLGRYYAPYRNYYYRPVGIGFRLDSLFFGSSYWISDPWQYRLPPADYGYRWVRYYDDVLLVDTYTGEVVDVIRDFFW